jgi:Tfp pilus assembly protein PilZ
VLGIAEQVLHEHYPDSSFSNDAVEKLVCYEWPGNVRELRNVVFRAVIQAANPELEITAHDVELPEPAVEEEPSGPVLNGDLDQVERQMIFLALDKNGGNQGKAAESLGISRRTLIRKLKSYREAGSHPPAGSAGTLSLDQQRYYRADLNIPVTLKYGNEEFAATLLNLSMGGAAVSTDKALKFGAPITLFFELPETDTNLLLPGRVAWSKKDGHLGVQFNELSPLLRTSLQRWLRSQMKREGWELASQ